MFLDQNQMRNKVLNLKTFDLLNFHCLTHSAMLVQHQNDNVCSTELTVLHINIGSSILFVPQINSLVDVPEEFCDLNPQVEFDI